MLQPTVLRTAYIASLNLMYSDGQSVFTPDDERKNVYVK